MEKLKEKILEKGYRYDYIYSHLKLSRQGFFNKLSGKTEFTLYEILVLSKLLKLTDEEKIDIFFANDVELKST